MSCLWRSTLHGLIATQIRLLCKENRGEILCFLSISMPMSVCSTALWKPPVFFSLTSNCNLVYPSTSWPRGTGGEVCVWACGAPYVDGHVWEDLASRTCFHTQHRSYERLFYNSSAKLPWIVTMGITHPPPHTSEKAQPKTMFRFLNQVFECDTYTLKSASLNVKLLIVRLAPWRWRTSCPHCLSHQ